MDDKPVVIRKYALKVAQTSLFFIYRTYTYLILSCNVSSFTGWSL